MIKYFNTGYISRYFVCFLIGLILWIPSFLVPFNGGEIGLIWSNLLFKFSNTVVLSLFSFILVLVTSVILNKFAIDNGFSGNLGTLVLLFYIVFSSLFNTGHYLGSFMIVNLMLIFVWSNLMRLPYIKNAEPVIFNASFLIGVTSFFYPALVLLFLLVWISIIVHRILSWRTIVITLLGVLLPYFFMFSWFFSQGTLLNELELFSDSINVSIGLILPGDSIEFILLVVFLFTIVISILGVSGKLNEKSINLRRNLIISIFWFILVLGILLLTGISTKALLLVIPGTIITAHWFSNVKKTKIYNYLIIFMLLLVFVSNYLTLFNNFFRSTI